MVKQKSIQVVLIVCRFDPETRGFVDQSFNFSAYGMLLRGSAEALEHRSHDDYAVLHFHLIFSHALCFAILRHSR